MRRLLIATRNKGKFLEIKNALKDLPFEFLSLYNIKKIPKNFEVEEKGKSFLENAVLKAKTFAKMSGFLTLADDSGLEVQALGGRPGIYSSRYTPGTDKDRYQKLLGELKNVPEDKKQAQFCIIIAIFDPQTDKLAICKGVCQGKIIDEPRGRHGFGYDPIFYFPRLGKTMAQLTTQEKNKISHRGRALRKAKKVLEKFL